MKKYRLKQWYPGLTIKEGTVVKRGGCKTTVHGNVHLIDNSHFDEKEFWEEVVEKDYEILSFSYEDVVFTTLRDNGKYFSTSSPNKFDPNGYFCGYTKEQELSFGGKVHSIKRLSDGEIFTIGDKITGATYKDPRGITGFCVEGGEATVGLKTELGRTLLGDANKVEEPLDTTEEYMSRLEAVQKYYIMNAPLLSLGEVLQAQSHPRRQVEVLQEDKLRKLINSKL